MSNNFFRIVTSLLTSITTNKNIIFSPSNLYGTLLSLGIHSIYSLSTEKNEEITVVNKYKMVNYGFTNFMIVDEKGRHFNVNNSVWYWKWDSVEDWEKINKNNKLSVKYYGWRSPFFGLFPNIVKSNY